jgi:putative ABC transport system ATP-binding protein
MKSTPPTAPKQNGEEVGRTTAAPAIELRGVTKSYPTAGGEFLALRPLDLQVSPGEFLGVLGKSGSGKSTLLNLIAGLDRPSAGEVRVGGAVIGRMSESRAAAWRGRTVGIVFQFFQLVPTLTVRENLLLAMDFVGVIPRRVRDERAAQLLADVGISEQADKLPAALSGGQQQRAAIARALANDPPVVVADEPTGNLDSRTADGVIDLFTALVGRGKTVVVVTHDEDLGGRTHRLIRLADGAMVEDRRAGEKS